MSNSDGFVRLCRRCQAELSSTAQFCPKCGAASRRLLKQKENNLIADRKEANRATGAIAVIFAGMLVGLIVSSILPLGSNYSVSRFLCSLALDISIGLAASAVLRNRVAFTCLRLPCRERDIGTAALAAFVTLVIGITYIEFLTRIAGGSESVEIPAENRLIFATLVVVKAPLIEEWLCRGIMWDAMRRISGPVATVLATSLLFAFLHILGGGGYLELPHRFVAGVIFGILRWKTNSIWPSVTAHFLNNLGAMIYMFI